MGKVPTATEASKKMRLTESIRKKKYPHAIANWPVEDRPREKLLFKGPEFLSNAELLAIFLRVGVKGKTAIGLAQELLSRFGSLRELYAAPLVGTTCILTEHDTRILYCGGLYKIRIKKKDQLDPYLFLALLNCPIVKRQMRAKQFTRDVIDTLGKRIFEVILPIPKDRGLRERIARETQETVLARVALRNKAKQISLDVEGITEAEEDKELLETI